VGIENVKVQAGSRVMIGHWDDNLGGAYLVTLEKDHAPTENLWPPTEACPGPVALSPDGRLAAASTWFALTDAGRLVRVVDLEGGREWVLELTDESTNTNLGPWERGVRNLRFTPDGELLSSGYGGVRRWNLETGEGKWLIRVPEETMMTMAANDDLRFLLTVEKPALVSHEGSNLTFHDLEEGTSRAINSHGQRINAIALDPTGSIVVTGASDGIIRAGRADGSEPHLLFGHDAFVSDMAISPDGDWIASSSDDETIRLWPMPDLSKPTLHTLPREELIAKLKTLTNLRAVPDETSSAGWRIEIGPFPGWEAMPVW
jgi:WD40 repeat protein